MANDKGWRIINMVGKVRWFNKNFGYGFIRIEDGKDVFVHYSDITPLQKEADSRLPSHYRLAILDTPINVLKKNEVVNFELEMVKGKCRARKVMRNVSTKTS